MNRLRLAAEPSVRVRSSVSSILYVLVALKMLSHNVEMKSWSVVYSAAGTNPTTMRVVPVAESKIAKSADSSSTAQLGGNMIVKPISEVYCPSGVGVGVGYGVRVGVGVFVEVAVRVGVFVGVGVTVAVAVAVEVGEAVGVSVGLL